MHKLAILASGSGSNAEAILSYFRLKPNINVELIISNNKDAKVLERAKKYNVKTEVFNSSQTKNGELLKTLQEHEIDFIVLAGYMKLIPNDITNHYSGRIVNIHPALLPKFGGKGMFGLNVHKAVVASAEAETGMTIHFVNAKYDEGDIIFQDKVAVNKDDSAEAVQQKVLVLEHKHYPRVIEEVVEKLD